MAIEFNLGNVKGDKGDRGIDGKDGVDGKTGPAGPQGLKGDDVDLGALSNIRIGLSASNTDRASVAIGVAARVRNTAAVALGYNVSVGSCAVAVGCNARTVSSGETAVGYNAYAQDFAVSIGNNAQARDKSIALGYNTCSLPNSVNIGYNVRLGDCNYLTDSVCIGYNTYMGSSGTSGYGNIVIGSGAQAKNSFNSVAIGRGAIVSEPNTIMLGNSGTTRLYCNVTSISHSSDRRVKEDIMPASTDICLADVLRLPVMRYKYKNFTGRHLDEHRTGFMADDVEKVFPKDVVKVSRDFPVLDEDGNEVYEPEFDEYGDPVMEVVGQAEGGKDILKQRQKPKMFNIPDLKTISMEMAIPTLWGAVQELAKRLARAESEIAALKSVV